MRQRATVYGHKGLVAARAGIVDGLCKKLLARAGFALNQHRLRRGRKLARPVYRSNNCGRCTNDIFKPVLRQHFGMHGIVANLALFGCNGPWFLKCYNRTVYRVAHMDGNGRKQQLSAFHLGHFVFNTVAEQEAAVDLRQIKNGTVAEMRYVVFEAQHAPRHRIDEQHAAFGIERNNAVV